MMAFSVLNRCCHNYLKVNFTIEVEDCKGYAAICTFTTRQVSNERLVELKPQTHLKTFPSMYPSTSWLMSFGSHRITRHKSSAINQNCDQLSQNTTEGLSTPMDDITTSNRSVCLTE